MFCYLLIIHPLSSIYHPSLMGVLMTTGSLWPPTLWLAVAAVLAPNGPLLSCTQFPIPAPKGLHTTQRVVVGWSDGGGEEGSQKPEQRWRQCIGAKV
jgi:hypothetical protein